MKTKMDQPEEVHVVDRKKPKVDQRNAKGDPQSVKPHKQINCKFCARKHEEEKEKCPAWGKTCDKCGAKNNFAVVFGKQRPPLNRKKSEDKPWDRHPKSKVNMVCQDEESDSDDYCLMVETINSVYQKESPKKIFATMALKETSVKFQLDSGATVNILPVELYQQVQRDPELK